jgi:hypothetical protein
LRLSLQALRLGFLLRGGATIGKLHHEVGVVFGDAMIEAFKLESQTAIFPRVVLSPKIIGRPTWIAEKRCIRRDCDGIYCMNYFADMLLRAAPPGDNYSQSIGFWFREVVEIMKRNLKDLESDGKLNPLAKWTWFARQFRGALENLTPDLLSAYGIPLDDLSTFL